MCALERRRIRESTVEGWSGATYLCPQHNPHSRPPSGTRPRVWALALPALPVCLCLFVFVLWVFRTNVTGDFGIVTEDFGLS